MDKNNVIDWKMAFWICMMNYDDDDDKFMFINCYD